MKATHTHAHTTHMHMHTYLFFPVFIKSLSSLVIVASSCLSNHLGFLVGMLSLVQVKSLSGRQQSLLTNQGLLLYRSPAEVTGVIGVMVTRYRSHIEREL